MWTGTTTCGSRLYVKRRGHRKIRMRSPPGSQGFLDEYRGAITGNSIPKPSSGVAVEAACSSLRLLVERSTNPPTTGRWVNAPVMSGDRFLMLFASNPCRLRPRSLLDHCPYATMRTSKVRAQRDRKAATPEAANERLMALRHVFLMAGDDDRAERNPARDVPYIKTGSQGFHTWTIEEVRHEVRHPVGTKARLALALLLFTGQRRSDVARFGRQHAKGGLADIHAVEESEAQAGPLSIPILPELQAVLDAMPSSGWACSSGRIEFSRRKLSLTEQRCRRSITLRGGIT
jgi:hypothetical protein